MSSLSPSLALRIGLAARAMPSVTPAHLMYVLVEALRMPLTDQKLKSMTVPLLRGAAHASLRSVPLHRLEQAVCYLTDQASVDIIDPDIPEPLPYRDGDLPGSVRVAIANDQGPSLDGQFSDCIRFLIYQVAVEEARLIDIRGTAGDRGAADRLAWRARLIRDCRIVFVTGIGIRGHHQLVRNGAYVIRQPQPGATAETLAELQRVLADAPPPWLARLARGATAVPAVVTARPAYAVA